MPDLTLKMIERRCADHGVPSIGELAMKKMEQGMAEVGPEHHLTSAENFYDEALEEALDLICYPAIIERRGGRISVVTWSKTISLASDWIILADNFGE